MNYNNKNKRKNKFRNLLIRKISSLIGNNRYRRRSKLNAVPYLVKNNPQKYGPGRNLCVINAIYNLNSSSGYRFGLNTQLLENPEFNTRKLYFRYFKVLEIRAVFPMSGKNTESIHYLNFSWNSIEESNEDIIRDDSTKIVPYYRPRTKIVRWRPIKSVINLNSVSQEVPTNFIDMSEFISTSRIVSLPGWLYVTSTSETDQIMLEILVEFRGNDFGNVPKLSKIEEMKSLLHKWEKELKDKENTVQKKFIVDPLPAWNFTEKDKEENKIEKEIQDENLNKNLRESIQFTRCGLEFEDLEPSKKEYQILPSTNMFNSFLKSKEKETLNTNYQKSFFPTKDENFYKEFDKVNNLEKRGKSERRKIIKDEIYNKLESNSVIINEEESDKESISSNNKRKGNNVLSNKYLQGENSKRKVLPIKDSNG